MRCCTSARCCGWSAPSATAIRPTRARAFARRFAQQAGPQLRHVHYGVLALGDWHYATFCGFGRKLDHDLRSQGAQALFPMVEVDNGNPEAMGRWQRAIADAFDLRIDTWQALQQSAPSERAFEAWRLVRRSLLNEGSQGDPLFEIELRSTARTKLGTGCAGRGAAAPSGRRRAAAARAAQLLGRVDSCRWLRPAAGAAGAA